MSKQTLTFENKNNKLVSILEYNYSEKIDLYILKEWKKIVESFWKLKFIKYPQDIFNLDFSKIENLDGWGKLSVQNLKYSIDQKKTISYIS